MGSDTTEFSLDLTSKYTPPDICTDSQTDTPNTCVQQYNTLAEGNVTGEEERNVGDLGTVHSAGMSSLGE